MFTMAAYQNQSPQDVVLSMLRYHENGTAADKVGCGVMAWASPKILDCK